MNERKRSGWCELATKSITYQRKIINSIQISFTYIVEVFSFKRAWKRCQDRHHSLSHSHDDRPLQTLNLQPRTDRALKVLHAGTDTVLRVHIAPAWICWQLMGAPKLRDSTNTLDGDFYSSCPGRGGGAIIGRAFTRTCARAHLPHADKTLHRASWSMEGRNISRSNDPLKSPNLIQLIQFYPKSLNIPVFGCKLVLQRYSWGCLVYLTPRVSQVLFVTCMLFSLKSV